MWIAKPLGALSETEESAWILAQDALEREGVEVPLAQTLTWARAIVAASGRAYLVFSPDEQVGGVVFSSSHADEEGAVFECVNGPLLEWDNSDRAARQLATFCMAVSKLDRRFKKLVMRPRWTPDQTLLRMEHLPVEPGEFAEAATLLVPVDRSEELCWNRLSGRLRRTLKNTREAHGDSNWQLVRLQDLECWHPDLDAFARSKGFSVPPYPWFQALMGDPELSEREGLSFWQSSVWLTADGQEGLARLLICRMRNRAHYLFGMETRSEGLKSRYSPASLAHWNALTACREAGVSIYDLNGYVVNVDPAHPYAGVCSFKEQWGGKVVRYLAPEFVIET